MLGSQPKSEGEENVHDVLDKKIIQWKKDKEQAFQKHTSRSDLQNLFIPTKLNGKRPSPTGELSLKPNPLPHSPPT